MPAHSTLVSVVIPSFNCASLLSRAVDSAFNMGPMSTEVLVVDDGSTDETPEICAQLMQRHPSLRVLRKANGGLSSARNHGILHATGKYLLLLDADDELADLDLSPFLADGHDMLRIGVEEITLDHRTALLVDESGVMTGPTFLQERFATKQFYPPACAYLYRRDWLSREGLHFEPGLIHEDMLFTVQALMAAKSVRAVPHTVYRYHRRPGSITTAADVAKRRRRIQSLSLIAGRITAMANRHPDIDLGWWVQQIIGYAHLIASRTPGRSLKWLVLLMQLRFVARYRHWGSRRPKWEARAHLTRDWQAFIYDRVEPGEWI